MVAYSPSVSVSAIVRKLNQEHTQYGKTFLIYIRYIGKRRLFGVMDTSSVQ